MGVRTILLALGFAASASLAASPGAVPDYLGSWTITNSVAAPWARPGSGRDSSETTGLLGRRVRFLRAAIVGPRQLACRGPHYEIKDYSADMLFQGNLPDAGRAAIALGFARPVVPTLETGCDGLLDFHFADDRTIMFGLNNRIYVMKRSGR